MSEVYSYSFDAIFFRVDHSEGVFSAAYTLWGTRIRSLVDLVIRG